MQATARTWKHSRRPPGEGAPSWIRSFAVVVLGLEAGRPE